MTVVEIILWGCSGLSSGPIRPSANFNTLYIESPEKNKKSKN